jgi:hypothetical protein
MRAAIFDIGPQRVVAKPAAPVLAAGQDPNSIEYRVAMEQFEADYRAYAAAERPFMSQRKIFEKEFGQAVEIVMWSVDAAESVEHDPRRFHYVLPAGIKCTARRVM